MSSFLSEPIDYARHNAEVAEVWDSYRAGKPVRVPVSIAGSITNFFHNSHLNTQGWSFEQFFTDPEIQISAQLAYQHWRKFHLVYDQMMGLPEEGWYVGVDFQNSYDASWFGCPIVYKKGYLPDTVPILAEHKEKLYDLPELLPIDGGLVGRCEEFIQYMQDYCERHDYCGLPIHASFRNIGEGTDGILDLAYKIRGAENILIDMYEDETYYHDLMQWITNNLIHRMRVLRQRRWEREPGCPDKGKMKTAFGFADDAITMISHEAYTQYVYPYHRQLVNAFCDGSFCSMHICGSNMQHFAGLQEKLGIGSFDTGFQIDLGLLRKQLGRSVEIYGGPTVMTVKDGTPEQIEKSVRDVLSSGVMEGGRFVLIAANNLAPNTPVENVQLLYETVRQYGRYPQ